MDARLRNKIEAMGTTLQFAADHPVDQPSIKTLLTRLQALYDASTALVTQQYDGLTTERAGKTIRRNARRAIRTELVKHLKRLVTLASRDHPELAAAFVPPQWSESNTAFIAAAKGILAAAVAQKDLLTATGIGETFFDDLSAQITTFASAEASAETGHSRHVGARSALRQAAQEGVFTIRALDGLFRKEFKDDAEVLARWDSASHVRQVNRGADGETVDPTPAPVPGPVPLPAGGSGAA
ncbi:MAG TPA: hypothetical protein VGM20_12915 [Gemmatimonadales bacterium]|jgi:hypothetical protein